MSAVIKVENLGKLYRLGGVGTGTISHDLNRWWAKMRGKEDPFLKLGQANDRTTKGSSEFVWALKDINFEVQQGDLLGVIGKNGAGKSTLLKILSRTTTPSVGTYKAKGRIASLLEVGTGFHPELSGRENIFLNGAILGMTKAEIRSKFDEIVDFSGVERYIDTPVKRYSSGMYVRLAFAVAAHLESEILIVDEVLAVGDAEFQKKCMGKMSDISKGQGRTVLFVSHNMAAVKSLCKNGIVLEHGTTKFIGNATSAVSYYLKGDSETQNKRTFGLDYHKTEFTLNEISLRNSHQTNEDPLTENSEIELLTDIKIHVKNPDRYHITYHLFNDMGEALFSFSNAMVSGLKPGDNRMKCIFPKSFFQSGTYYLSIFIIEDKRSAIFVEKDIMSFTVVDSGRALGQYMGREPGNIRPSFKWENNT
ncbi:MAG: ATP-binding cassette domain-containing protein [Bacteroidetes bacterium]|nr:ATP-binding cassette domain-containing protein [Bacteroidota bacterium]